MKLGLNLSGVSVLSSRVVLPTGNYPMEVVSAEVKENKAKTGGYIQIGYKVLAGEHKNSVVTDIINIQHPNEDAVRIGLSTLKTVLTVGGHKNPDALADSDELLGLKLNIYVEEEDHTFTGSDGNEVETTQNRMKAFTELDMTDVESKPATKPAKKEEKTEPAASPFANSPKQEVKEEKVAEEAAPAPTFPWQQ